MSKIYVVESGIPNDPGPGCSCIREEGEYTSREAAEAAATEYTEKHYPEAEAWVVEYDPENPPNIFKTEC